MGGGLRALWRDWKSKVYYTEDVDQFEKHDFLMVFDAAALPLCSF